MSTPALMPPTRGFYGKLPTHGDFLSRGLPPLFLDPWDRWLQEVLRCSREQLGEDWLEVYLTSPIWRFALSSGVCGTPSWAGVLMPSVDRVGRYFPLTIAASLPASGNPMEVLEWDRAWFAQVEALALGSLEDGFDLERFDQAIQALPPLRGPAANGPDDEPEAAPPTPHTHNAWRFPLAVDADTGDVGGSGGDFGYIGSDAGTAGGACPALLGHILRDTLFAYSAWWSAGSERIAPSWLVCQGLPPMEGFVSLLAGDWQDRGWNGWNDRKPTLSAPPPLVPRDRGDTP